MHIAPTIKVKSFLHKVNETENGDVKVGENDKGEVEAAKIPPPHPFRYILLMETKAIRGKHSGSQWYGSALVILSGLGC
jgi:hypothetical protein